MLVVGPCDDRDRIAMLVQQAQWARPALNIVVSLKDDEQLDKELKSRTVRCVPLDVANPEAFRKAILGDTKSRKSPRLEPLTAKLDIHIELALLDRIFEVAQSSDNVSASLLELAGRLPELFPATVNAVLDLDSLDPAIYFTIGETVAPEFIPKVRAEVLRVHRCLVQDVGIVPSCPSHLGGVAPKIGGIRDFGQVLVIPALARGRLHGVLALASAKKKTFSDASASLLYRMVYHLSRLVATMDDLRHLTLHDPLTGLYSRTYLETVLERAWLISQMHGHPLSMVLIDIDGFREINEGYGYPVGDKVLREFARVVEYTADVSDTVARWGGDEIAVILPFSDAQGAVAFAERLMNSLRVSTFSKTVEALGATVSIGLASRQASAEGSCTDLLNQAAEALMEARKAGGGQFKAYGA
jgi:diguanylate cyclase (GGDEF)-like protein